jgi:two-component system LytT family response regulator
MSRLVRVLIADDEPLARDYLRALLRKHENTTVVAEAASGTDAVAAILEHRPELIFLDVQMPELDGFGVVRRIGPAHMPAVVFVTAYDRYALQAFDVQAMDYLLKPFDEERFDLALARALRQLRAGATDVHDRLEKLVSHMEAERQYVVRIPVKTADRIRFVDAARVDWIEADGKNVKLHVGKETYSLNETLAGVSKTLDPRTFVRVHRSAVVNVASVQEVQPWFHGDFVLILNGGTQVTTGRLYRKEVRRLFDRS